MVMQLGDSDLQSWDDSVRSIEDVEVKRFNKKEAALKRERALAYAFSQLVNCLVAQYPKLCM